jgi:hypothetical protein
MKTRWFATVSIVAVLAGCGQPDGGIPNVSTSTTTNAPPVQIGDVTLTRSGGIAGITSTVTVRSDGSVVVTNDTQTSESVLAESDLDDLHTLVGSPEFAALSNSYVPPEGVCCDFFFYTVTARVGDRTIESNTADTLDTPPVLQQVIDLLLGLMS